MSDLETPVGPMSPVTESANTDTPKTPNAPEPQEEALPIIECLCTAECTSVSGRSTLTYAIGRHPDQTLHLRIVSNSGGGMFCGDWASGDRIDALVAGGHELTSRSFHALHPGKSINTGGFVMSALRDLGLIRLNPENSRHHEHVEGMDFAQVALAALAKADTGNAHGSKPPTGRKPRFPRPLPKGRD